MIKPRKVSFETLGCRYNRFESAEMAYELENAGFAAAGEGETSDIVVINTCSVTSKSAARCRAAIRQARAQNPGAVVVVAGCYSQTNPAEAAAEEGVGLVLGNVEKFELANALKEIGDGGAPAKVMVGSGTRPDYLPVRPVTSLEGRTNAYIKAQSGCDEECSFCVVRIARGKSVSARPDDVVAQVRLMAGKGVREVVFTGINLGQFGGGTGLCGLIKRTLDETSTERVRLSSINPQHVTDELIELMASSPRICRHLHIPLQNGSDRILAAMRRPYTSGMYETLLGKLAKAIPGIGIGADVMVGFPGETEEDFNATYSLIERSPLMMLHVFTYSPREGTEAYSMKGRPPKKEAKARAAMLKKLSGQKRAEAGEKQVGGTLDALVENTRDAAGNLKGFSDNYFPVTFKGPDSLMSAIVPVKIISAGADGLSGAV
ncbi:MAG: tRNA (N(6)-L-threonylcarbamoyladenosine(37)-C(2))-methylthiotransferase MtaB [Nitrospinae bacterium]|nr:tRNA (N(6)-L-threonylcarbamoyladenosine(37)-C(2))-methylthiotransferase MtaB [Nitrospinota bacterium]